MLAAIVQAYSPHGWIDPYPDRGRAPAPPSAPPPRIVSRLASVVIDFIVLKLVTTLLMVAIGGVAILALLGGADGEQSARLSTAVVLVLGAITSVVYFLWLPWRNAGDTLGRRLAGVKYRGTTSAAPQLAALRHNAVVFVLPSLLLDPVAVIGLRDATVLVVWCALSAFTDSGEQTLFERAAGLKSVVSLRGA